MTFRCSTASSACSLGPKGSNEFASLGSHVTEQSIAAVRTIMVDRSMWTGSASGLLRLCAEGVRNDAAHGPRTRERLTAACGGPQTFLRTLGIEIASSREGRMGTRMITISTGAENTVSTVRAVHNNGPLRDQVVLAEEDQVVLAEDQASARQGC